VASTNVESCEFSDVAAYFGRGSDSSYTALALTRVSEREP
jgi:hypothetical protein